MRSLGNTSYRAKPSMNVTPLVDVVLVLLIIFMVVIPAMEKSAQVDLPNVFQVDAEPKGKTDPFTLSLTRDGQLYFEQESLLWSQLERRLRVANQREPARRLVLRADRAVSYGDARRLFKSCQEIGFPGISLRVNERKQGGAP